MLTLEALAALVEEHREALSHPVASFTIGSEFFGGDSSPSLMGVVNRSADSWYRESVCLSTRDALERTQRLFAQGAAVVDIGGESSLPDAEHVQADQQKDILLPVVRGIAERNRLISVETYHPEVAESCLKSGAGIINLTGSGESSEIYKQIALHQAGVIICFVQGENVREVGDLTLGSDPIPAMREFFGTEIERARSAGVERIFIDPGLGFYYRNLNDSEERVRHQMKVFLNTFRLRELGWPICHALPHAFEYFGEEVRTAESFFAVLAALGKTSLFRTHEVPKVRAVLETLKVY